MSRPHGARWLPAVSSCRAALTAGAWLGLCLSACQGPEPYYRGDETVGLGGIGSPGAAGSMATGTAGSSAPGVAGSTVSGVAGTSAGEAGMGGTPGRGGTTGAAGTTGRGGTTGAAGEPGR